MTVYAHRGASKYAPENTMSAFRLAYEQGADGIETDVHLTKDYVPVLIHDHRLERTTDGVGKISDYTYDELRRFDAGSWFHQQFQHEKIVSLEAFLQWIHPKHLLLNLELKNNHVEYNRLEEIVTYLLKKYNLLKRTVISTFNPKSIRRLRQLSNVNIALIRSRWRWNLIHHAIKLGADAIHIHFRLLNHRICQLANKLNLPIRVYSVNHKQKVIECIHYGCHSIFSNAPKLCLRHVKI